LHPDISGSAAVETRAAMASRRLIVFIGDCVSR
jgi:hypothetical protein